MSCPFFQATGTRLSTVMNSLTTAVACTVYALYNGWKLSLVVMSFIPFLIFASAIQIKLFTGLGISNDGEDEVVQSGKVRLNWLIYENLKNTCSFSPPDFKMSRSVFEEPMVMVTSRLKFVRLI